MQALYETEAIGIIAPKTTGGIDRNGVDGADPPGRWIDFVENFHRLLFMGNRHIGPGEAEIH